MMLLCVNIFSVFLVSKEQKHKCIGEDCPVCACVYEMKRNLQDNNNIIVMNSSYTISEYIILQEISVTEDILCISLVAQKVRLNN